MRDLEAELAQALRERDELIPLESENERLRVRAETAEADADRLAEDLKMAAGQWGSDVLWRKWSLDAALTAHAAAVEARHAD